MTNTSAPADRVLSVITAAWAPSASWLYRLGESLAAVQMPEGWGLEWIVQEDGDDPRLGQEVGRWPFARYGCLRRHRGPAVTRNLALSRCGGKLVVNFDHDDEADPDGLCALVTAIEENADLGWAVGRADDLLSDGSLRRFGLPLSGPIAAGALGRWWKENERLPVHTVGFVMRIELVRALGGWISAATSSDDTNLVMSLSALAPGLVLDLPVVRYRRWTQQASAQSDHESLRPWAWKCITQRLDALESIDHSLAAAGRPAGSG